MPRGDAHPLDVGGADALLAGGHPVAGGLFLAQEPLFHGGHAAVDQQQAGVVLGHQGETAQAQVALRLKEGQVFFTQFIQTGPLHKRSLLASLSRWGPPVCAEGQGCPGSIAPRGANTAARRKEKTAPAPAKGTKAAVTAPWVPPNLRRCQDRRLFCRNNAAPAPGLSHRELEGGMGCAAPAGLSAALAKRGPLSVRPDHIPGPVIAKLL